MTEAQELELIELYKQECIDKARASFWQFCKLLSPDFYMNERPHLKTLCDTLQQFYERGIVNHATRLPYRRLIIEVPPRHGKSRTLTNFSAWILGLDNTNKIITASHNDELAQDFSRHTRDIIAQEKNLPDQIVYSDIFTARIKKGDAAFHKWALQDQFFNYKGTGIGGSITGRGGNVLLIDDPIKDAQTAYNPTALESIWLWYTGTFMSRAEEGAIEVLCMTPWAKGDMGARLQKLAPDECYVLSMPACTNGVMLCPDLLSLNSYNERKAIADVNIFAANYDMQRLDIKGRLYSEFKTYKELPENTRGAIAYTDTADEGKDYLCSIHALRKGNELFVTDILYTQEAQEITEPLLCDVIEDNNTREIMIESNNGGRAFARNIQRLLQERKFSCAVKWFHQSKNKQARILTNATVVQQYVYFPEGWETKFSAFYFALTNYQKEGRNQHDDAADALTGIVEVYGLNQGSISAPTTDIRARLRI